MSRKEIPELIQKIFIPLLTSWLLWVTKAVVSLQSDVAVIKYSVFKTVSNKEPAETKAEAHPHLDADLNLFQFLERKK